jgi:hypothetical protein
MNGDAGRALKGDAEMESPDKDPIATVIGDIGRWQLQRIAVVFLVSMPGLCHIFCVVFGTVKVDYWCADNDAILNNDTRNECVENCSVYRFDNSEWQNTIQMEYGLVCDRAPLVGEWCLEFLNEFANYYTGCVISICILINEGVYLSYLWA